MTEKRFAEWCQNVRDGNPPGDVPPGLDASVQRKAEAVRVAFDDDGTEAAVRACDAFGLELRSADGTTAPENGLHLLTGLGDDATLADVGGALHAIAASVNGADKLSRALLREGILRELQARGIGAAATMADAALGGQTPGVGVGQGAPVFLETPAPWDEAVDGADMLDELAAVVRRFCVLPDGAADAIALWVVHTYCVDGADITPRLALTSPTKRCGKTTVLSVLGALVNRPLIASNATSAVIFRGIEAFKPTLLLDEADTFLAARDELRGVLNAGHSRTTGFVLRCDGDDHEPRLFGVFTPVAIAMIGALPDTLADRSLEVGMERKAKGVEVERWRVSHAEGLISTCRRCARWAADNHDTLRDADPVVPAALGDRCADNWRPLLAIADTAGGVWPARACCAASLLSGHPD
ncbi:DUF3631 domain-containing protein, partial [Candidatus Poribacteria bacterium]|nr:DUF3631 domain-containing protein [Candidatus Poribacteria bacterium]